MSDSLRRRQGSRPGGGGHKAATSGSTAVPEHVTLFPFLSLLAALVAVVVWDARHGIERNAKIQLVVGHAVLALVATFVFLPALPQPLAYHAFADSRRMCCVPNGFDVLSNVPFLLVGAAGLAALRSDEIAFTDEWERLGWSVFFAGVAAVSVGSAYYHWRPTNPTLVWDRLPMSVAFMALFALVLEERFGGMRVVFAPLVLAGVASVFYWSATDDLRPYLFVQFYPMLCIPALYFLFPSRYTRDADVFLTLAWYVVAKIAEAKDRVVFDLTGRRVSGHTIKHLTAAAGLVHLHLMLSRRGIVHSPLLQGGEGQGL